MKMCDVVWCQVTDVKVGLLARHFRHFNWSIIKSVDNYLTVVSYKLRNECLNDFPDLDHSNKAWAASISQWLLCLPIRWNCILCTNSKWVVGVSSARMRCNIHRNESTRTNSVWEYDVERLHSMGNHKSQIKKIFARYLCFLGFCAIWAFTFRNWKKHSQVVVGLISIAERLLFPVFASK